MAFGLQEWGIVLVVVLLLFGATAIPKLARSFGRAQGEFQKAREEMRREVAAGSAEAASPASLSSHDEQSVRKAARELGIPEAGMPLDDVKRRIQQKLA